MGEPQPVCLGYCRVSSQEQAEHGYSLSAQEETIRRHCAHKYPDRELRLIVDDGVSAFKTPLLKRPGGRQILSAPRGSVLVVTSFDRAWRSVRDYINSREILDACGIEVDVVNAQFPTGGAIGKLVVTILAAVAEWESAIKSERTRAGLDRKRRLCGIVRRSSIAWTRTQSGGLLPRKSYVASIILNEILKARRWHNHWRVAALDACFSFFEGKREAVRYWTKDRQEALRKHLSHYIECGVWEKATQDPDLPRVNDKGMGDTYPPPPGKLAAYFLNDGWRLHVLCVNSKGEAFWDGLRATGEIFYRYNLMPVKDLVAHAIYCLGFRDEKLGPFSFGPERPAPKHRRAK